MSVRLDRLKTDLKNARRDLDRNQKKFGDQPQWRALNGYLLLAEELFAMAMRATVERDAARHEVALLKGLETARAERTDE